jgi:hypothetical protein
LHAGSDHVFEAESRRFDRAFELRDLVGVLDEPQLGEGGGERRVAFLRERQRGVRCGIDTT